jgi:hypothetical protein
MRVTESKWHLEFSGEFNGKNLSLQYWTSTKKLRGKINIAYSYTN